MPPELIVKVVGDTSGLERSFSRAGKEAKQFDRNLTHAVRGAVAGSGAFSHLGRSLAFASGGFVAFASVSEVIRKSVDAARDAGVAQKSLAAQLHANKESFKASEGAITKAGLSLGKFGFTVDDSVHALTVLDRATGSITKAISLQAFTANLARAKNIDLASAALTVGKVFGRQETALRRAVPGLEKNAHGLDLIRDASLKLKGQAAANTTEAQKFAATLHDTEVIIGTALLPTLDKLLSHLGDWLDKMNRTGRLQRDVNKAVQTGTDVFHGLEAVITPLANAFKSLGTAVGGTKNEVELLGAAVVAFKAQKLVGGLGLIGSTAKTSTSQVAGLRGALLRLGALGVVTVGVELLFNRKGVDKAVSGFLDRHGLPGGSNTLNTPLDVLANLSKISNAAGSGAAKQAEALALKELFAPFTKALTRISRAAGTGSRTTGALSVPSGVRGQGNLPLTAAQQLQVTLGANPDSITLLKQQADRDRAAIAFAGKLRAQSRISNAKYVTEVSAYQSDLQQTLDHITSITTAAAKAVAARLRANIPGHVSGEAFGDFRFGSVHVPGQVGGTGSIRGPFTQPILLELAAAKAAVTTSGVDDLSIAKKLRKAAQDALKSGRLTIQGQIDAWNEIKRLNDQINGGIAGEHSKFKHLAGGNLLKALGLDGLDRDTKRKILAGISQVGPHGLIPTERGGQFTGTQINIENFHSSAPNFRQIEEEARKRARSRPAVRRGAR